MRRYIFLAVLLLALPLTLVMAQDDTLLRSTLSGDISNLNPIFVSDSASFDISAFLWSGLFQNDPQSGLPLPDLTSWEISEDGLSYTFTIRDDAVWSDGTPITSNDVKFTYEAIINDAVASPRKSDMTLIQSLNVVDDKTFEIVLSQPNCTVWGNTFGSLTPIPAHVFKPDFSDLTDNPFNTTPNVTSGPYIVDEWKPSEYIRLVANPRYYGGEPQIPTIINRVITDTAVQNQALLTGEVDYVFMYPDQLEQLQPQDNFNPFVFELNNTPMLILNWGDSENPQAAYDEDGNLIEQAPNKFFSDVRVRQAIAMGYDKDAIMATLGENGGFRLTGPVTSSFEWAIDPSLEPWPYDPERAAELLDEAGWTDSDGDGIRDKDGVPFSFEIVYSPLVDLYTNIALVAQDQLGQLGIEVKVTSMEWSAYLSDVLLPQKYDATIVGFGGGSEVDGIAYNILLSENDIPGSGFNIASYVNPRVDELLKQGRSMAGCSPEERAPIYQEIQRIAKEEVAYDFTVGTNQVHVMNKRVTGYEPGPWNSYWQIPSWGLTGGS